MKNYEKYVSIILIMLNIINIMNAFTNRNYSSFAGWLSSGLLLITLIIHNNTNHFNKFK